MTRRLVLAICLIVGFVATAKVAPSLAAAPRIALVIGNSAYAETPLANPANDARLMVKTLAALGFDIIERIDVDRRSMTRAIHEFGARLDDAGNDAVGLFYYAGHGVQVNGENYLIPLQAEITREPDVTSEAVAASWVLGQMEFAGNRMNFVILDACRNNPLTRSFRSSTRGLARMDAPRGSLIAYSTAPGDVAADGDGVNSPYTLALSRELRRPGIAAEKMFKLVRNSVLVDTDGLQTPWEESSLTGEDFFFAAPLERDASASAQTPSTDAAANERVFWQSIQESANPANFEAYLDRYPEGAFATLARIQLDVMAQEDAAEQRAVEAAARESERKAAEAAAEAAHRKEVERKAAERKAAAEFSEEARRKEAVRKATGAAAQEAERKAAGAAAQEAERKAAEAVAQEAERKATEAAAAKKAERKAAKAAAQEARRVEAARKSRESALWASVEDSTNASDFQVYIDAYPTGRFVDLAQIRMVTLATGTTGLSSPSASTEEIETAALFDYDFPVDDSASPPEDTQSATPVQTASIPPYDGHWYGEVTCASNSVSFFLTRLAVRDGVLTGTWRSTMDRRSYDLGGKFDAKGEIEISGSLTFKNGEGLRAWFGAKAVDDRIEGWGRLGRAGNCQLVLNRDD